MICPVCKIREATYHLTDNTSKAKSLHLCEECKKNISLIHLFCEDLDKIIHAFDPSERLKLKSPQELVQSTEPNPTSTFDPDLTCEHCGVKLMSILQKGIVGCEHDYVTFAPYLEKAYKNLQIDAKHFGKQPLVKETDLLTSKLHSLEFKLKKAIEIENYELAGELSKEINNLKKL